MRQLTVILLFILLSGPAGNAQLNSDQTLMTVNGKDISAGEFLWLYRKNNSGQGKMDINEYLEIYTLFRLKVEAATDAGIDQTDSFREELESYRKQLSRSYLTDQGVKEELLKKAYQRYREEIHAYHILISCPADASPADTLEAWEKAKNVRERLRLGEPFKAVARGASDDPDVMVNGGDLGYFTVFQTPLVFENAVYSMQPGNLSKPVRTADGYHIIKVQDRRPSSGRIRVAHIMKATPPGTPESKLLEARMQIDTIYSLAINEADFSELAKRYSDDRGSSSQGGELPWFGAGEMVNEFAEVSFSLMHNGDISKPFKTAYGWHIVKRLEKEQPLPFEEARRILESKMSQSYLQSVSRQSFVEKLKKEYNYRVNDANLVWLTSIADSAFRSGTYRWNERSIPPGNIYTYADRNVTMDQFVRYINNMGKSVTSNDSVKYIRSLIDLKSYDDLIKYEESHLPAKYPEYRYLVNEFHDGILLFEISDRMVWSKLRPGSDELRTYWESRKNEFMTALTSDARIITIASSAGKSRTKKLIKEIRKEIRAGSHDSLIASIGMTASRHPVSVQSGSFKEGENSILDMVKKSKGSYTLTSPAGTHIVIISDVRESVPLPFEEAQALIIDDFQAKLESEWHTQLREKYNVTVNNRVLSELQQSEKK